MGEMRSDIPSETPAERNARLRENRDRNIIRHLQNLIADLAENLCDEGPDYSEDGLHKMRSRVANALPVDVCPEWLTGYRDPDGEKS